MEATEQAIQTPVAEEPRGIATMPVAIVVLPPDLALLVSRAVDMANGLVIESGEDYEASVSLTQTYKAAQDQLIEFTKDNIKRWFEGHRAATKQRTELLKPFGDAGDIVERKRREFREKARLADMEKERKLRDEAKRLQDAAAMEQAKVLQDAGEPEAAEAVVEMAAKAPPPAVVVTSSVPKVKGAVEKKVWKFKVINPAMINRQYLMQKDPMDVDSYPLIKGVVETLGLAAIESIGVGSVEVYQEDASYVRRK